MKKKTTTHYLPTREALEKISIFLLPKRNLGLLVTTLIRYNNGTHRFWLESDFFSVLAATNRTSHTSGIHQEKAPHCVHRNNTALAEQTRHAILSSLPMTIVGTKLILGSGENYVPCLGFSHRCFPMLARSFYLSRTRESARQNRVREFSHDCAVE